MCVVVRSLTSMIDTATETADTTIETTAEMTAEMTAETTVVKSSKKTAEKTFEKKTEKKTKKTIKKIVEKTIERIIKKTAETESKKITLKTKTIDIIDIFNFESPFLKSVKLTLWLIVDVFFETMFQKYHNYNFVFSTDLHNQSIF